MGIIYALSVIALFIVCIFIKKTDKKIDILRQIVLTIVLLFCYNTFICYVLTFFTIPITLLGLSIINFAFSALGTVYLIKTKQRQKYSFNKIDMVYIMLIGVATTVAGCLNFGFPFEIKYETGDPAAHYLTTELFKEGDALLAGQEPNEVYGDMSHRKTASYVNSGLIAKCFENVIDPFDDYNIFIAFGIFILFLTGWMFYSSISRFAKNNVTRFLAFIVSLLYVMGYPLNSLLFGFEYFSMGILILGAIIASIDTYQKEEIKYGQNLLVFFLLDFGLFAAYYMFVPYVYSGLWIYFCIHEYSKNKKVNSSNKFLTIIKRTFTKRLIIQLFVTLLVPFILGYIYHITPGIYKVFINNRIDLSEAMKNQNNLINKGLAKYGYIYVNLFSNMIPLLPFAIVAMYKNWKENEGPSIITFFAFAVIFIFLIGYLFGKVSTYYLMKNYFALWLLLYYLSYKGLLIMYEKNKFIPLISVGLYIVAIIFNLLFVDTKISHGVINKQENILQIADIFGANKTIYKNPKDLTSEELDLLRYAKKNIPEESTLEVVGDMEQGFWAYSILRRINNDDEQFRIGKTRTKDGACCRKGRKSRLYFVF